MRVNRVKSLNFRTLEDFEISLDPHYCAISGRNNAGKSAIVSIIQFFLRDSDEYRFNPYQNGLSYSKDATQWSSASEMTVSLTLTVDREEDSETFFVIEKFNGSSLEGQTASVCLTDKHFKESSSEFSCHVNDHALDPQSASEVLKKLRSASNLILHNSTRNESSFYYAGESYTEILETNFSAEDRKRITEAQTRLQNSVKKAAKQHKEELDKLLGMLNEKYQVELSSIAGGRSSKFPLEVKLTDKRVHVSLKDWGAGTQNRTRILISILEAIRTRESSTAGNRTTPVFIVEEPESFLHPSAQAEFGQVLNSLARELNVQIIATTHSPYMLNQSSPEANYLAERRLSRGIPKESSIKDTSGSDWMLPFAENLGVIPEEFNSWKHLFGTQQANVVIVEGQIDKDYIEHIKDNYPDIYTIPDNVEIVPYGGKDALKNTSILQFMINKFGKVYITFDLDADSDVSKSLERIGLKRDADFCSVGINSPGAECIEGLLPIEIKRTVFSNHHDIVTALSSQDSTLRKSAKNKLKHEYLVEFKNSKIQNKDLKAFKILFDKISAKFNKPSIDHSRSFVQSVAASLAPGSAD